MLRLKSTAPGFEVWRGLQIFFLVQTARLRICKIAGYLDYMFSLTQGVAWSILFGTIGVTSPLLCPLRGEAERAV
jgi:hypothetical protein